MHQDLFNSIYNDEAFPKWNPVVARNICYEMMQNVESYIHDTFVSSQGDYPALLKFTGIERVDPKTEFEQGGWNKKTHEITQNSSYLVRVMFEYDGEQLEPFYMYLPYCYKGGLMVIGGAKFALTPVLIDPCISITDRNIYIPVGKNKIIFKTWPYHFLENGERRNKSVVYATVYRGSKRKPGQMGAPTRNMNATMAHYLFARYGLSGTFEKYLGVDSVAVGHDGFDNTNYPEDEWVLCSSFGRKPDKLYIKSYYAPNFTLAIRKEHYTDEAQCLIAALFYIADHFPAQFNDIDRDITKNTFYQRILATVILPFEEHAPTAFSNMQKHITSLLSYVDEGLRQRLIAIEGIRVHDIFDLFANILFTYQERVTVTTRELTTMYNKQLVLLPYLLQEVIHNIYSLGWDLQASKEDPTFDKAKAERKIKNRLKGGISFILKINTSKHKEAAAINSATDNLITKISSPVVTQARMSSPSSKRSRKPVTPDMTLSISIAEVGDLTSDAGCHTGRSRLNMFVKVSDQGYIERNPELIDVVDKAQQQIGR